MLLFIHFAYHALYVLKFALLFSSSIIFVYLLSSEVYHLLDLVCFVFVLDYSSTPFLGSSSSGSICFYLVIFHDLSTESSVVYLCLSLECSFLRNVVFLIINIIILLELFGINEWLLS